MRGNSNVLLIRDGSVQPKSCLPGLDARDIRISDEAEADQADGEPQPQGLQYNYLASPNARCALCFLKSSLTASWISWELSSPRRARRIAIFSTSSRSK